MKKILLAGVAVLLAAPALAADLPARSMAPAPMYATPMFSWTGFYVGADVGYVWTKNRITNVATGFVANPDPEQFSIGGHIGYRHQFAGGIVVGLEGDASWLNDQRRRGAYNLGAADALTRLNWDASVRASLGYSFGRFLPYLTGGVAFTEENGCATVTNGPVCAPGTGYSGTRTGWTLGAGVAYAVTDNWIVKAEYRYADFGSKTYATPGIAGGLTRSLVQTNKVMIGLSYKFGGPAGPVVAKY